MLVELQVEDLGIIEHLALTFGTGMTAFTGETGAGKTLVVEAIDLLVGGRADSALVRPGADEARVEGRFVDGDDEIVLARVVPRDGRSRAYVDGRMATAGQLAEVGARLVDLHGQHAHQSLLRPAAQRDLLDAFGAVDLGPLTDARARLSAIERDLAGLGGDPRARAREIDLLRFQLAEINEVGVGDVDEDAQLSEEEDRLADAVAHREAAEAALEALGGDGGSSDRLAEAVAALRDRGPYREIEARGRALSAELSELASDLRDAAEMIEPDPERLAEVRARRRALRDLCRKYGEDLEAVARYAAEQQERLDELAAWEDRAAVLDESAATTRDEIAREEATVGAARRAAAPGLASRTVEHLHELAMPHAEIEVAVGADPGDEVELLVSANPGSPPMPLIKVASGGELARTMLAIRLVLTNAPPTLVFDEVDAGIGGSAATAVGRALARIGASHQVFVVTHLAQVAAWADAQVAVEKATDGAGTVSLARVLDHDERVVELSRMLSGSPESGSARLHADELLAEAVVAREGAR
ncbi:MAG: DNA repair protein RecN [Actinomycetota bacterium]|nr:DNA repair protein RecN [Actinomycetota bacterium]